jgi:hypothetical protein
MEKTNLVIAAFVAAVLAGLYIQFGSGMVMPMMASGRENFEQKEVGMPLNSAGIGPFDGVSIGGGISGWAANESAPILPAGTAPASSSDLSNQLMLLADNKVSSECCPSTFSNDVGCVCLTEHDRDVFASRGGNRT